MARLLMPRRELSPPIMDAAEVARFWARVVVDCACDCWVWVGSRTSGYGQLNVGGRGVYAHRAAYSTWRGAIYGWMTLDHLCRVRACVNPAHLEPVTLEENKRRGYSIPASNARKTHCKRNHPFDEANTYRRRDRPGRHCLECRRLQRAGALT